MRPAPRASRPDSTASRIACAIATGSSARETALASSTPEQPSSIAVAASEAVPMPASRITGTPAASTIRRRLYGLRIPMPLPIGDPSGITAAQPASSSRRARIGSSFVYGSTTKPSFTSSSAASSSSVGSGSSVRSSPITSSFTQSVSKASRASCAVVIASRAVKQPAVFGRSEQPASARTSTIEPRALGSTRLRASVARSAPDARTASPITSRLWKPPVPMIRRERNARPAIVRPLPSATLHRLYDLDAGPFLQRHLVPAPARHHLAVERDSDAAALARGTAGGHGLAHGRAIAEVAPLAVEDDLHTAAAFGENLPGPNGSTASGGASPETIAATA